MADLSLDNLNKTAAPRATTAFGKMATPGATPKQVDMTGTPNDLIGAAQSNLNANAPVSAAKAPPEPVLGQTSPILSQEKKTSGMAFSDSLRKVRPDLINATVEEDINKSRTEREMQLGKIRMDAKDMIDQATTGKTLATAAPQGEADIVSVLKSNGIIGEDTDIATIATTVSALGPQERADILKNLSDKNPKLADELSAKLNGGQKIVVRKQLDTFADGLGLKDPAAKEQYIADVAKDLGFADITNPDGSITSAADQLKNLDINDFIKKTEDAIARDTSKVKEVNKVLTSPSASPAERNAAQAELVRMGAHGSRTIQEETADLGKNMNKANDISMGGKTYTSLGALVKDPELAAIMTRALSSDPLDKADQEAAVLQLKDIGLMNAEGTGIFDKYSKALSEQLTANKSTLASVIAGQKEVAEAIKLSPTVSLASNVVAKMVGATDGTKLSTLTPSVKDFMTKVKTGLNDVDRTNLVNSLNGLSQVGHDDIIKTIATAPSAADVKAMLPHIDLLYKAEKSKQVLDSIDPKSVSDENINSLAAQGLVDASQLNLFKAAGMSNEDIYANVNSNVKAVTDWADLSPELRPFAAAANISSPKKMEMTSELYAKAINSPNVNIDNLSALDLISTSPTASKSTKDAAAARKSIIQTSAAQVAGQEIASKYAPSNPNWPNYSSIPSAEFMSDMGGRINLLNAQKAELAKLDASKYGADTLARLQTSVDQGIEALTKKMEEAKTYYESRPAPPVTAEKPIDNVPGVVSLIKQDPLNARNSEVYKKLTPAEKAKVEASISASGGR